jgi:hypothetical protein
VMNPSDKLMFDVGMALQGAEQRVRMSRLKKRPAIKTAEAAHPQTARPAHAIGCRCLMCKPPKAQ